MFAPQFMMPTYMSYMPLMYPQGAPTTSPFMVPSSAPTSTDSKAIQNGLPASNICISSLRVESPHEIQAKFTGVCNCSSCSSVASSRESSCGSLDSKNGSAFSHIDEDILKGRLSLGLGAKPEHAGMYPNTSIMTMSSMGMGMGMPRLPMGMGGMPMPMMSMFSMQAPYPMPVPYPTSTPAVEVVPTRTLDSAPAPTTAAPQSEEPRPYTRKRNTTKRYHCSECPKKFHQRSNLITHVRTHTGEKPFACPFPDCQRRFSQSSNLRRHQRIHSRDFSANGTNATATGVSTTSTTNTKSGPTPSERSTSPHSHASHEDEGESDSEQEEEDTSAALKTVLEADETAAASSLTNLLSRPPLPPSAIAPAATEAK